MPLVGEHQAQDRQLIADLVLAEMNQLAEREANAPQRPTTMQPSQVGQRRQGRRYQQRSRSQAQKLFPCCGRELSRRETAPLRPPRTASGAPPKAACSTSSTVTALPWVRSRSRPTERPALETVC